MGLWGETWEATRPANSRAGGQETALYTRAIAFYSDFN